MSKDSSDIISVNSYLYLHPNESPAVALVLPVLDINNYHSWKRSMTTALIAKNKFEFVDGSTPEPAKDEDIYQAWRRCNNMVVSWLVHSVHSDSWHQQYTKKTHSPFQSRSIPIHLNITIPSQPANKTHKQKTKPESHPFFIIYRNHPLILLQPRPCNSTSHKTRTPFQQQAFIPVLALHSSLATSNRNREMKKGIEPR